MEKNEINDLASTYCTFFCPRFNHHDFIPISKPHFILKTDEGRQLIFCSNNTFFLLFLIDTAIVVYTVY